MNNKDVVYVVSRVTKEQSFWESLFGLHFKETKRVLVEGKLAENYIRAQYKHDSRNIEYWIEEIK